MKCIKCYYDIDVSYNFCNNCGEKIIRNLIPEEKLVPNFYAPLKSTTDSTNMPPREYNLDIKIINPIAQNDKKDQDNYDGHKYYNEEEEGPFPRGNIENNEKIINTSCHEFRGQSHFRPKPNVKYWAHDKPNSFVTLSETPSSDIVINVSPQEEKIVIKKKMLPILIPFYNEEADDLMITINSLYSDMLSLEKLGFDVHILLVMDGWWKASESMKKKMQEMFPQNENYPPWWTAIKPIAPEDDFSKCVGTFIVQRMTPDGQSIQPINIDGLHNIKISLLAKRDNRRKINAHDWILSSFADFYNAEFVFLTDCGTLFAPHCLTRLVKELLDRKNCTAVSGRQRVMSAKQQNANDDFFSMESLYRAAQCYDYESSLAVFVGAFSLFGMLPVIPGPCGLYRYSAIKNKAVPFYINTVAAHPSECGIMMANLNLAEDRVLSYAAVVETHENAYTCYVPEAVFYFAAETTPLQLFQQRRRWINGTIAGYLWLLSKPSIIWNSGLKFLNKPFISLLLICQVFMYIVLIISPAIFAVSSYWSLKWLQSYFGTGNNYFGEIFLILYGLIYVVFVIKHSRPEQKPPVINSLVHFATFINAIAMIFIMTSMISGFVVMYKTRSSIWLSIDDWEVQDGMTLLIAFSLLGPLFLALFHSLTSFMYMLFSIVQFYLLLPTMVAYIGAYSLSRVWDLSWGNRPSEKSSLKTTLSEDVRKQNGEKIKKIGMQISQGVICTNLLVAISILSFSKPNDIFVVLLAIFIFSWSAIQMVFSILYFVIHNTRRVIRLIGRLCCVSVLRCYTKKEWYTGE
ncbi:MAG: hypothetical protein Edafosvirus16_8 [Edafosvirus sp.]|uniref:chitin synthase n=1 Tax=Edafosvirus sp. TaxID=2487765 RepID=A0A3G4ZYM8_9VIRU|nr:MAG: hypothetical protein Edafosvirus16_8 [Edafosvirus sp.]